jgi:hypothetical protein
MTAADELETLKTKIESLEREVRALRKEIGILKSHPIERRKQLLISRILGITGFAGCLLAIIVIAKPLTWLQVSGLGGLLVLWLCLVAIVIRFIGERR